MLRCWQLTEALTSLNPGHSFSVQISDFCNAESRSRVSFNFRSSALLNPWQHKVLLLGSYPMFLNLDVAPLQILASVSVVSQIKLELNYTHGFIFFSATYVHRPWPLPFWKLYSPPFATCRYLSLHAPFLGKFSHFSLSFSHFIFIFLLYFLFLPFSFTLPPLFSSPIFIVFRQMLVANNRWWSYLLWSAAP